MRILPVGDRAVLVEDPPGDPASWSLGLRELGLTGIVDVVPAARTVLITVDEHSRLAPVVAAAHGVTVEQRVRVPVDTVIIPTVYDGPDLAEVAERTGRSVDDVIALHASTTYRVAFCGFAPGFGYLRGLPVELHLPRRVTPRTRVPAGSVAIAAEYSAVYPGVSPGGWHLLGTTELALFDVRAEPPALLQPGTLVRFEAR